MYTNNGELGGGRILQFFGGGYEESPYFNNELIKQFYMVPLAKVIIALLLIGLMVYFIMKIFEIKSFSTGKGIVNELNYINKLRQRDNSIVRYNKLIKHITNFIEHTPFAMGKTDMEYWEYNLTRANIRIPGGARVYKPVEFHAIITFITGCVVVVALAVLVFANAFAGFVMIILAVICANSLPMLCIRQIVMAKDDEIKENFSDYYLMLHYVILSHAKTPLAGIMRSYAKTTDSKEMVQLVDTCVHYIDTYGEYEATRYIAKAYREIPAMGKLMRLIRQANDGGNVDEELMGFRKELLEERRYTIEKRTDKLIMKARASFNILMPVLVQAVISAMSIYLEDISMVKDLFGGM